MKRTVPTQQAHGIHRRKVGDLVVTLIVDGSETFSFDILSRSMTADEAKCLLIAANLAPVPRMPVNAYLVQDGQRTILIDAGDANCMGTGGRLHAALSAAGVEALQVDTILLTHAHPDHVGGLAENGSRLFPNAELVLHADEFSFWNKEENIRQVPHLTAVRNLACSTFTAYRSSIRTETGGEVVPGITMKPLPGHTPGHSGYLIQSGKEELLIWGDIVHWPDIQIPRPDVTLTFDIAPEQMIETRKRLLEQLATDRTLIGGMHLNFPGFIRLHPDRSTYAIEEERWLPDLS